MRSWTILSGLSAITVLGGCPSAPSSGASLDASVGSTAKLDAGRWGVGGGGGSGGDGGSSSRGDGGENVASGGTDVGHASGGTRGDAMAGGDDVTVTPGGSGGSGGSTPTGASGGESASGGGGGFGGDAPPSVDTLSSLDPNFSNNGSVASERFGTTVAAANGELGLGDWIFVRGGSTDLRAREALAYQYAPLGAGAGYLRANWDPVPDAEGYNVTIVNLQSGQVLVEEQRVPPQPTTLEVRGLTLRGAWENSTLEGGLGGPEYQIQIRPVTAWAAGGDNWREPLLSNPVQIAEAESWDGIRRPRGVSHDGSTEDFPQGHRAFYGAHVFERVDIDQLAYVHVQPFGKEDDVEAGADVQSPAVRTPADGWLGIYANQITVAGRVDAAGRGYGGGGGSGLVPSPTLGNFPGLGGAHGLSGNGGGDWGGAGAGAGGGGCARHQRFQVGGSGGPMGGGGGGCTLDNCGDWGNENGPNGVSGSCAPESPYQCSGGRGGEAQACDAFRGGNGGNGAEWNPATPIEAGGIRGTQGPGGGGGGFGAGGGAAGSASGDSPGFGYVAGGGGGGGTGGQTGKYAGRVDSGGSGAGPCSGAGGRGDANGVQFGGRAGQYGCDGRAAGRTLDRIGSGGGGGGAADSPAPAGGGGGAGGGSIRFRAAQSLVLLGTAVIRADGAAGGGGAGDAFGPVDAGFPRYTGGGGGGGGGGIELIAPNLRIDPGAIVRSLGGEDGHGDAATASDGGSVTRVDSGGILYLAYGDGSDLDALPPPNTAFSSTVEDQIGAPDGAAFGYYTSSIAHLRRPGRLTRVEWDEPRGRPAGSTVSVFIRVASAASNGDPTSEEWSDWQGPFQSANGADIPGIPSATYVQYRVRLTRGRDGSSPVVGELRFSYVED